MKAILSILLFCCISISLSAQFAPKLEPGIIVQDTSSLPTVFQMGEFIPQSEQLGVRYNTLLLEACGNDMNRAYMLWMHMMRSMEEYSDAVSYDLKGIKCWIKVFWDKNGTVDYISFFLKPNSRNIDPKDLQDFFSSFVGQYQLPYQCEADFSHYGSVSFPTFPVLFEEEDKNR